MDIQEGVSQNFNVHLYMANAATAIVIDTVGSHIRDLKMFATGFATDFSVCDSLYYFNSTPVFRMDKLPVEESGGYCFAAVHFPSRNPADTKVIIDSDDPFVTRDAESPLWNLKAYVTLPDGTVTETVLGVTRALQAGELRVIKVKALENGAVSLFRHQSLSPCDMSPRDNESRNLLFTYFATNCLAPMGPNLLVYSVFMI